MFEYVHSRYGKNLLALYEVESNTEGWQSGRLQCS